MMGGPYDVGNGDKVMGHEEGAVIYGRQSNKKFQKIYNNSPMAVARQALQNNMPQPSAGPGPGTYPGTVYQPGVGKRPQSSSGGFDPMLIPIAVLVVGGGIALAPEEVAATVVAGTIYALAA